MYYQQFWHEVEESNEWLQYQLSRILPQLFSSKTAISGSTQQIKKTMNDMFDILRDYLQWQTRLDILFERAKHVVPLKARSEKMMKSRQVQVMIDYKTKEVWNWCPHPFSLQLSNISCCEIASGRSIHYTTISEQHTNTDNGVIVHIT